LRGKSPRGLTRIIIKNQRATINKILIMSVLVDLIINREFKKLCFTKTTPSMLE
jgi:hypothetical protein